MSSSSIDGTFTFKSILGGNLKSFNLFKSDTTNFAVYLKSSYSECILANDIAILGTPSIAPSIAQLTVPEYKMSEPKFGPWLIPEITKSGCSSGAKIALIPSFTQSPGVPFVTHVRFAPDLVSSNSSTLNGVWRVRECPAALLSLSGATTYTS